MDGQGWLVGVAAVAALSAACAPAGAAEAGIAVTRVIDGDTFEVAGGDRVRVLGIDSCEANTRGGPRATAAARTLLDGQRVRLTAPPQVDRDRYGRLLRYVTLPSGDFGKLMVPGDHTGVYAGRNDADPAYVAELRRLDVGGRDCAV